MAELRYNFQGGVLGANLDAPVAGTVETITGLFAVAPDFATLVSPDYIKIVIDNNEICYLTAYDTSSPLDGKLTRGAEDAILWPPQTHALGTGVWQNNFTVSDLGAVPPLPSLIAGVNVVLGLLAQSVSFFLDPVGGDGEGEITCTGVPMVSAAASPVAYNPRADLENIDTTNGAFAVDAELYVSNMDATQQIQVSCSGVIPQVGPGQSFSCDWTTATAFALAGSDLTWDGSSTVSSTAGGVFMTLFTVESGY